VVVSSLAQSGSQAALAALEAGAVDVLAKPSGAQEAAAFNQLLPLRVKGAAAARWRVHTPQAGSGPAQRLGARHFDPRQIILIGSSTGGVEALTEVIPQLPDGLPGICIVQHIPPKFSAPFAERLNQRCSMEVREAADNDEACPGRVLIAPGDFHMELSWRGSGYRVSLNRREPVHFCRPSVDVMFESAAACAGVKAVAVILTGMGSDGADGMQRLKAGGARTIAQDQGTSVVFGMPRVAIERGVVDRVVALPSIAAAIVEEASLGAPTSRTSHGFPASAGLQS
jgi:two-component system chemotaxis response regulator CheB